jgi:hypothetical protein
MAPQELALHTQDLVDVMFELENCKDARFVQVYEMVKKGNLLQLNVEEGTYDMDVPLQDFWDAPVLSGVEELPLDVLPTPAELQHTLKQEVGGENRFRFAPSRGSPEADAHATKALLNNITNPLYTGSGAILHAKIPTLDHLQKKETRWNTGSDGCLGQTDLQVTIAPAHDFFDIKVYSTYRLITLLAGKQVVVAYPPTLWNTCRLIARLKQLSGGKPGPIWGAIDLEKGVAIIQKAGEPLTLPPHWSFITLTSQTCVSIGQSIATPLKYPKLFELPYTDLMIAQFNLWPDKSDQQREITGYAESLATHRNVILLTKIPHFTPAPTINLICRQWDYSMKQKMARVLAAIEVEAERTRIFDMIMQTWVDFVEMMRIKQKKLRCRLCHERLEKQKNAQGVDQGLVDHVMAKHGPPKMWEEREGDEESDEEEKEQKISRQDVLAARTEHADKARSEAGSKSYKGDK